MFVVDPDAAQRRSGIHFDLAGVVTRDNGFRVPFAVNLRTAPE